MGCPEEEIYIHSIKENAIFKKGFRQPTYAHVLIVECPDDKIAKEVFKGNREFQERMRGESYPGNYEIVERYGEYLVLKVNSPDKKTSNEYGIF